MGNTLLEIDNRTFLNMSIDSDSTTYPKATRRVPKINSVIKRICDGNYKNILTGQNLKGGDMEFLRKKEFVQGYEQVQTITNEVTSASTEIDTSSTADLPSSGKAIINGCVFAYTGKSANQLTGVTGVIGTHAIGSIVKIVHQIDSTCAKPFNLFWIRPQDGKLIPRDYLDYKYQDISSNYWTVFSDNADANKYIDLNFSDQDEQYWHYYFQKPTVLVGDANETEIPEEYGVELVALLASGEMLRETEQWDQGKNQLTLGYAMLEEFYNTYISKTRQFRKKVRMDRRTPQHVYQRKY